MEPFSVKKARKILGKSSDKYTDREIEELINIFTKLAGVISDIVGSKDTTTGIDLASKRNHNYE